MLDTLIFTAITSKHVGDRVFLRLTDDIVNIQRYKLKKLVRPTKRSITS